MNEQKIVWPDEREERTGEEEVFARCLILWEEGRVRPSVRRRPPLSFVCARNTNQIRMITLLHFRALRSAPSYLSLSISRASRFFEGAQKSNLRPRLPGHTSHKKHELVCDRKGLWPKVSAEISVNFRPKQFQHYWLVSAIRP